MPSIESQSSRPHGFSHKGRPRRAKPVLCDRPQKSGWRCARGLHPDGTPCAALPCWWNVVANLRWGWQSYPL